MNLLSAANTEIERSLVVDAMDDKATALQLLLELTEEDFTDPSARDGYRAIKGLISTTGTVDMFAFRKLLLAKGRKESLETLSAHFASAGRGYVPPSHYAALVAPIKQDTAVRLATKALNQGLYRLARVAGGEDSLEAIQDELLRALNGSFSRGKAVSGCSEAESLEKMALELERVEAEPNQPTSYLRLGFDSLDEMIGGGCGDGELIVVGARPGMGKSAFALAAARHWATQSSKQVVFFTKEMTTREKAGRLATQEAQKPTKALTSTDIRRIRPRNVYYYDQAFRNISDVCMQTRRHAVGPGGVGAVVIDYLQRYCRADQREVSEASSACKDLAMELGVPVMLLSQLSRGCESRDDRRPQLSDLRDSGSIEQDANKVLLLFRAGYYREECRMYANSDPADADVTVAKNRNGATGRVNFKFYGSTYTFREDTRTETPEPRYPFSSVPMHDIPLDLEIF